MSVTVAGTMLEQEIELVIPRTAKHQSQRVLLGHCRSVVELATAKWLADPPDRIEKR